MAGKKGRSGRRRISDEKKLEVGIYRPDKSGALDAKPKLPDRVETPELRNPHAAELWETHCLPLINAGVIKTTDVAMAKSMCQLWGLYCEAFEVAHMSPTDKDARISVTSYWTKFEAAAARFGMNPSDRSRLRIDKPTECDDSRPTPKKKPG